MRQELTSLLCALLLAMASAARGQAPAPANAPVAPAPAFVPTADGTAVLDVRARTLWARCVEGMTWNGATCVGTPLLLTRAEASARAKARAAAEGVPWRLPRTLELRRLVDKQADVPGVNPRIFPGAPPGLHWSGTATVREHSVNIYDYNNIASNRTSGNRLAALEGWAVDMDTAEARGDVARNSRLPVRLVRGAPAS